MAAWAYLLERAKASGQPGEYGEIDLEDMSLVLDLPEVQIAAVLTAMEGKGLISSGAIRNWGKRQHKTSTERVQKHRSKQREAQETTGNEGTQGTVTHPSETVTTPREVAPRVSETVSAPEETVSETHRNAETAQTIQTDRQTDSSEAKASGAKAPVNHSEELDLSIPAFLIRPANGGAPTPAELERRAFEVGREVLGKSAGGVVTKLRRVYPGDDASVITIIEEARGKSNPMEWVQGVLKKGRGNGAASADSKFVDLDGPPI